ncbi:hypothetical protein C2G38_2196084 [Gigaspora rosea]|uniref:Uncharacterized protein n=1 Tax=Gigaspora rosea TaxID=44941 RepID=A0A397V2F3_9GLOM|nr:hypothetical protein C2G38_2196084 [Gigaspora rosea]
MANSNKNENINKDRASIDWENFQKIVNYYGRPLQLRTNPEESKIKLVTNIIDLERKKVRPLKEIITRKMKKEISKLGKQEKGKNFCAKILYKIIKAIYKQVWIKRCEEMAKVKEKLTPTQLEQQDKNGEENKVQQKKIKTNEKKEYGINFLYTKTQHQHI